MNNQFNLQRFLDAQNPVYDSVLRELEAAKKASHWMWFIFPQIVGLGQSHMAVFYAIKSTEEARAYFEHAVLGNRLLQCIELVSRSSEVSTEAIFGDIDNLKFRSCLTLFDFIAQEQSVFNDMLGRFYGGIRDEATLEILSRL